MKLNTTNLTNVFMECLFTEEEALNSELISKSLIVEGVNLKVGFHPNRIKQNTDNIISMLNCLPDKFLLGGEGGGASFLDMVMDENNDDWTSLHADVDKLITLGLAINYVSFLVPRKMWEILPGGLPYVVVNNLKSVRKKKLIKINEK